MKRAKKRTDRRAIADRLLILPELLLTEQVAEALGLKTVSGAIRAIKAGRCGAYSKVGRRYVVRRTEFLRALRAAEGQQSGR